MKIPSLNSCRRDSPRHGFTLIEVMVSLAILGILAALAMPSFSSTIQRYRVNALRDDLMASMQQARSEAIRRGTPVSLIRRTTSCPDATADWGSGWVIAPGNTCVTDTAATVIQLTTVPAGYQVFHTASDTTRPISQITFDRWGQTNPTGTHAFTVSPPDGDTSPATRTVSIGLGGVIKDSQGTTHP